MTQKRLLVSLMILISVFGVCMSASAGDSLASREPEGVVAKGTPWETPYYVIRGAVSGPTIVIVGGTHGNELAGWNAALELLQKQPDCGQLVIIPKANINGVNVQSRVVAEEGDLNRCYPGKLEGIAMEQVAYAIFHLIQEFQPVLVLDLHESIEFHLVNNKYLGQSLIVYPEETGIWAGMMSVESLNATLQPEISDELEQWTLLQGPVEGSTAWAVGKYLGIPAMTVETCRKLALETRIRYQIEIVISILKEFGVILN